MGKLWLLAIAVFFLLGACSNKESQIPSTKHNTQTATQAASTANEKPTRADIITNPAVHLEEGSVKMRPLVNLNTGNNPAVLPVSSQRKTSPVILPANSVPMLITSSWSGYCHHPNFGWGADGLIPCTGVSSYSSQSAAIESYAAPFAAIFKVGGCALTTNPDGSAGGGVEVCYAISHGQCVPPGEHDVCPGVHANLISSVSACPAHSTRKKSACACNSGYKSDPASKSCIAQATSMYKRAQHHLSTSQDSLSNSGNTH